MARIVPSICTRPSTETFRPFFKPSQSLLNSVAPLVRTPRPWTTNGPAIETPSVSVPGLLAAECATNENATYLKVTVNGVPSDARVDDISGDLMAGTQVQANWGLHLIDVNLGIGNFLDIVGQETKAYLARAGK